MTQRAGRRQRLVERQARSTIAARARDLFSRVARNSATSQHSRKVDTAVFHQGLRTTQESGQFRSTQRSGFGKTSD